MVRIVTIIGTRPEIIKMAPVIQALDGLGHEHVLVHSGQHYDLLMDRIFFRDLGLRAPDHQFELKDRSPSSQVASTIREVAPVTSAADLVHVVGNSVIDALTQNIRTAEARSTILRDLGLSKGQYVLLTFHRKENVARPGPLAPALDP